MKPTISGVTWVCKGGLASLGRHTPRHPSPTADTRVVSQTDTERDQGPSSQRKAPRPVDISTSAMSLCACDTVHTETEASLVITPLYSDLESCQFYDLEHPFSPDDPDFRFYSTLCRDTNGPILELGCGTGRLLVPILRDVEPLNDRGSQRATPVL